MAGAEACLAARLHQPQPRGSRSRSCLLGGLPGKISTHTPDVCYRGAGYDLTHARALRLPLRPRRASAGFRTALATRGGTNPSVLRIFWSWNASKGWTAPEEPAGNSRRSRRSASSMSSARPAGRSSIPIATPATIS